MLIADRYEPTGAKNWGGMAEVHTCDDLHLKRKVALKRVIKAADFDRLEDELKALLRVRSRHVVELLDIVTYEYLGENERGLILEFIEGADLHEGIMKPDADYLQTLWQIASGLSDIHSSGVIHRDIKPANCRRSANGTIKIIDFGLSRELDVDDMTKSIIGSNGYIAPELTKTGEKKFTKAVDVYAFGATAVALVLPVAQQVGILSSNHVDQAVGILDPEIVDSLKRCIAHNPDERPAIEDVRNLLERKILKDRHRGWINVNGKLTEVSASSRNASIKAGLNSLNIGYDGENFIVVNVIGSVSINNKQAVQGMKMNSSCLLTFGPSGGSRAFVTFDVSNPEIAA